ncbi:hypothetical protein PR202_gb10372 [Eleusine coracana subsp. coracana]|uniref:DUF6598 domain-containing protein n=1 Tax=Eleusine coracana subsp. coracana TaxID=191504 RepID=A0AAV5EJT5_ELECO|nr:hypothetical protein PR202_gb10372 [Eleusine coracana subsp. coracana]
MHMGKKRDRDGKAVSTTKTMWDEEEDAFWAGIMAELGPDPEMNADQVALREEERIKRAAEATAAYERRMLGEEEDDDEPEDFYASQASNLREVWTELWGDDLPPLLSGPSMTPTLQMFSVKVSVIREGLKWPLHVYGIVAVRDSVDHNRNIMFNRTRDNCQILTEKDSSLVLTGPSRAVIVLGPVTLEVELKLKGSNESEDKVLSFIAAGYDFHDYKDSRLMNRDYPSMLSTLEFTFAYVVRSVEATITVQVTEGSWPEDFHGQVTACTSSMGDKNFVLLDSGDDKVPVDPDGTVKLSRRVASVELAGELAVYVRAWQGAGDNTSEIVEGKVLFKPKKSTRSFGECDVGFCILYVSHG